MADKQEILSLAVADLVSSLTNPVCVDPNGVAAPNAQQPKSPVDPCPAGFHRSFSPIVDMHVGFVSSSLGGYGSDACPDQVPSSPDCGGTNTNFSNNDHGHLVDRTDGCSTAKVPTYQGFGYLAWDPAQKATPPGEMDIAGFTKNIENLVVGMGQIGCGFEAQLEGWYRFLVDPKPYQSIAVSGGKAVPSGVDDGLLQQRAEFLRPDSLLAIVMLTDENDCSVIEGGQYYVATQLSNANGPYHLPPARSECATNPNDPCCKSCGQPAGVCPVDPGCSKLLDGVTDNINLRCFEEKKRLGIDFLYPTSRYSDALHAATVKDLNGTDTPNPLFTDLSGGNAPVRDPSLVMLTGIVGVPWQDVARDLNDLGKGYKSATELTQGQDWDKIVGDISAYKAPTDPFMQESIAPRMGANPITGEPIEPPGSLTKNPINGTEYTIDDGSDLQYACTFPLLQTRDCSKGQIACDCDVPTNDKPVCASNPADGGKMTLQVRAKAYPGLRQLEVLKQAGEQGVVASICPAQLGDATRTDFAYRPIVATLVERMRPHLK